jgi:hypothetical protein
MADHSIQTLKNDNNTVLIDVKERLNKIINIEASKLANIEAERQQQKLREIEQIFEAKHQEKETQNTKEKQRLQPLISRISLKNESTYTIIENMRHRVSEKRKNHS